MDVTIEERVHRSRDLVAQLKESIRSWSDEPDHEKRDAYWAEAVVLSNYVDDNEDRLNTLIAKRNVKQARSILYVVKETAQAFPGSGAEDLLDVIIHRHT